MDITDQDKHRAEAPRIPDQKYINKWPTIYKVDSLVLKRLTTTPPTRFQLHLPSAWTPSNRLSNRSRSPVRS